MRLKSPFNCQNSALPYLFSDKKCALHLPEVLRVQFVLSRKQCTSAWQVPLREQFVLSGCVISRVQFVISRKIADTKTLGIDRKWDIWFLPDLWLYFLCYWCFYTQYGNEKGELIRFFILSFVLRNKQGWNVRFDTESLIFDKRKSDLVFDNI